MEGCLWKALILLSGQRASSEAAHLGSGDIHGEEGRENRPRREPLCRRDKDIIMPMGLKGMFMLPILAGHVPCKTENFQGDKEMSVAVGGGIGVWSLWKGRCRTGGRAK